jgi:hypothetical protein
LKRGNNKKTIDKPTPGRSLHKKGVFFNVSKVTLDNELSNRLMEFFRRVFPVKVLLVI